MLDNMDQVENKEIVQMLLGEAVLNYQVKNAAYSPGRIIEFVVFGNSTAADELLKKIDLFSSSFFANGSYACIKVDDEHQDHSDDVLDVVTSAARSHTAKTANKLLVVPVVIQENVDKDKLNSMFNAVQLFFKNVSQKFNDRPVDLVWLPCAVMFDSFISGDSRKDFKQRLLSATQSVSCGFTNAALFLFDRDSQNFEIRISAIVRSLVLTSFVFSENQYTIANEDCNADKYFYSSAFSLQMPIHVEILKRAMKILNEFLKTPQDHSERLQRFGNVVSNLPKEKCWSSGWSSLPVEQSGSISIAPILSFQAYGDGNKDTAYIQSFSDEYYLSKLSLKQDESVYKDFLKAFWDIYRSEYGRNITGISDILETGNQFAFVNNYIKELHITHSYSSAIEQGGISARAEIPSFVREESKRLERLLTNRIKDFYFEVLNEKNTSIKDMISMHKKSKHFVESLRDIIFGEIKYWQAEEITHDRFNDTFEVTDDMLGQLLEKYVEMLNADSSTSEQSRSREKAFVRKIFDLARIGYQTDAYSYLLKLETGASDGKDITVNCYDRVKKLLTSDRTFKCEYHIILNKEDRSELAKEFSTHKETAMINTNIIHRVEGVSDRFYLICITEPQQFRRLTLAKEG